MTIKQLFPNIVTIPESYLYALQPLLDEKKIHIDKVFQKMMKDKEYERELVGINVPDTNRTTPFEFLTYHRNRGIDYLYKLICKIYDTYV